MSKMAVVRNARAALALGACLLGTPCVADAEEYWGAFVATEGTYGPAYGVSWNYPSREEAVARAARECGKKAGYSVCDPASEILYKFSTSAPYQDDYNFQVRCFAVAKYTSPDDPNGHYGGEPGVSANDATRNLKREWGYTPRLEEVVCNAR